MLVLCQFPSELTCNASAFAEAVSYVYFECGNHFKNTNILSAEITLITNCVKNIIILFFFNENCHLINCIFVYKSIFAK